MAKDNEEKNEYIEELSEEVENKVKKLKKKLKKLKEEKQEYLDGWQRERAAFANYKKDIQKYIDESRVVVKEESVTQFLNIVDNLELMVKHVPKAIEESDWYKGVGHIAEQARQTMKNMDVEEVKASSGDDFDPELHEAVEGEGEVIEEVVQKGYKMNGKLIRPVKVKVKK
ncbi:MAG: nucleotide exchange factor GrpE [Candidatus Spechtbacterales bacterium]|nr:nucleotide exchange factor GrpE [Candidatus Spechtbacterales bacterium]